MLTENQKNELSKKACKIIKSKQISIKLTYLLKLCLNYLQHDLKKKKIKAHLTLSTSYILSQVL